MQLQERLIVPGLGVVILLSIFMLGAPVVYLVLLGVLGLAAVGTYAAPHAVQVETRIGIAALGLILLIFYFSSLGFWLALLAFGTIGALQIRYRDTLQTPPQTIAWLNTVLARRSAAGAASPQTGASDQAAETAPTAATTTKLSALQGKVSVAGIGAPVLGIIVLSTVAMPWYTISFAGASGSYTGLGIARDLAEDYGSVPYVFVWTLGALALVSMASAVLPRVLPLLVGIAGLVVTILALAYISVATEQAEARQFGIIATFGIGAFVSAGAFILIAVLHCIPGAYKSKGKDKTGD